MVVQWPRLWAPKVGGLGSISSQGTRSHIMLQLKILHATTKISNPTNNFINLFLCLVSSSSTKLKPPWGQGPCLCGFLLQPGHLRQCLPGGAFNKYLSSDGINEFNESLVTQPTEQIEPWLLCRDLETGPLHDSQVFERLPCFRRSTCSLCFQKAKLGPAGTKDGGRWSA